MSLIVVDASVAAKWCLPRAGETLVEEAFGLLRRYSSGEIRIIVPDVFWPEMLNVLWKAVRLGRLSKPEAEASLEGLRAHQLTTVSSFPLLDSAFAIACTFGRTAYDSLYVALAVDSKGQLVTADERLANALAAQLPVRWLGAP